MRRNRNRKGRNKGPAIGGRAAEKTPAQRLQELLDQMNHREEMTKPTPPTGSGGSPAPSVPPTRLSGRAMSNTMLSIQGTGDDGENDYSKDSEDLVIQILAKIIPDIFELGKIGEELMKDKDKEENEGEKCEGGEGGENEEEKEKEESSESVLQSLLDLIKNLF